MPGSAGLRLTPVESVLLFIVGVLAAVIGLAASIALHEVGHLVPAKRFGVRVTQYMIGFGPTLFSRQRGETEYGVKAIPLGGYVAMIGMYPPAKPGEAARTGGTGFMSSMIDDARLASAEGVAPGEESRTYSSLPVWKRIVIMVGGPAMNFVIAILGFMIVCSGFGLYQPSTTVGTVYECVVPAGTAAPAEGEPCETPAPAFEAGLMPGDTITSVDGVAAENWDVLQDAIRVSPGAPILLGVDRAGEQLQLEVTPRVNTVYQLDDLTGARVESADGSYVTEEVGFVGITPTQERTRQSPLYAFTMAEANVRAVGNFLITIPERIVEMWNAGFGGAERDPNGPMSVVGVGRITGEVAAETSIPVVDRVATIVQLVASVNIALGVINLVPLPPLDGGHILAALIDGIRRRLAKLFGRPDPGPFDTAKLLPVTLVIAGCLMAMSALFIYVDIVNPIRLFE